MSRRQMIGPEPADATGVGRQYQVYPLQKFPIWKQWEIAIDVQEPSPPGKWLSLELCQMPSRANHEWYWQRGIDPDKQRPSIPDGLRTAVYERDGYACLHCGSTESLSLDHIHPFSLGGNDTFENLQTLCRSCNSKKGARV